MQTLHSVCPTESVYVPLKHGLGLANGTSGQWNPLSHCEQFVCPAEEYSPGLHLTGLIVWLEHLLTTEQCNITTDLQAEYWKALRRNGKDFTDYEKS